MITTIHTGSEVYIGRGDYETAHSHFGDTRNWNLLLSLAGEVKLAAGGRETAIPAGTLFLIAPGPPRRFTVARYWKLYYLHFNMDAHIGINPAFPEAAPGVYAVMPAHADFKRIRRVFAELFQVCGIRRHGWYLLAYNLIQELILRGNMAGRAALGEHVEAAAKMLDNLNSPRRIDAIAGNCAMSRSGFFSKFRSTFGTTPAKYREQQMLARAQSLLENTDMSIKEIAQELGVCQPCYFTSRFKKAFGVPPREYRQRRRGRRMMKDEK